MYCRKCGQENKDDSRFCLRCGASLQDNQPTVQSTNKGAAALVGVILSIVSAILCLISAFNLMTSSTYSWGNEGAELSFILAAAAAVFAILGIIFCKKQKNYNGHLKTTGVTISIISLAGEILMAVISLSSG